MTPFEEDSFLWEKTAVEPLLAGETRLTNAEKTALRVFVDVVLQSCFALEDPCERFAKHVADGDLDQLLAKAPRERVIDSDDLPNHLFDIKVADGVVGFESNPPKSPALARVVLYDGRWSLIVAKVLLIFERSTFFKAYELSPLQMTDGIDPALTGNRYFRLVPDAGRKMAHDVACLIAWVKLEDGVDMLEMTAWPVEKV